MEEFIKNLNDKIIFQENNKVAVITINLPERKNSLDEKSIIELQNSWIEFENSDSKVAIITGSDDYFCAGIDLKKIPDASICVPGIGVEVSKPIISSVNGPAIGLGLTLVMQSDLCIASDNSYFLYPEAKIGYSGGLIAGLVSRIPHKIAMEILLMGKKISSKRAYEFGLVNEVTKPRNTLNRSIEIANEISELAPLVLSYIKKETDIVLPKSNAQISGQFLQRVEKIKKSNDRLEGLRAFQKKEKPKYSGN